MQSWKIASAAVVLGASPLIGFQPASASPLIAVAGVHRSAESTQPLQTVQYRHRWHAGMYHRYGYGHRHHGGGPAVLGGLAAGAVIGGAIADSQARASEACAYCSQRYRSYDPGSGTYLGYDGNRHPCP